MPSSALNAPLMRPDWIRKAAMYWATRVSITSQPAQTTTSVIRLFRSTSSIEKPSTPRK